LSLAFLQGGCIVYFAMDTISVTIESPNFNYTFDAVSVAKLKPDTPIKTVTRFTDLIVTTNLGDLETIYDHCFKDVTIVPKLGGLVIKTGEPHTDVGIFALVDWLHPECSTLLEVLSKYDGRLYFHNNAPVLSHVKSAASFAVGEFIAITAYNSSYKQGPTTRSRVSFEPKAAV
jgi:hypothetical protein